ncbi:cytochrome c biogenesis protein [Janibacter limosus]|uniref:Cytochrome c biogenesis protein n=1 Tax=Janibacter limosus TaxID=53458 RepID=A0AC61U559_9MICO|nr:cytochrome c biogenesis protein [Janibacter limosus]UUZ44973.1 cytochrome c biogenesis protein [Janibacter limosus]
MIRNDRYLAAATGGLVLVGLAAALAAPSDRLQGDLQRLMYVHVPAARLAYLSFGLTLAGSVAWLWRRQERWDRLAASSAEVGVFFTGLAIVRGAIWGKPVWGVWWTRDPRLVTTAVLLFVYRDTRRYAARQWTPACAPGAAPSSGSSRSSGFRSCTSR